MQERALTPPDENTVRKELFDALKNLRTLEEQSINLFDKPLPSSRALQLIQQIQDRVKDLNHIFQDPTPEENRILQDLIFNAKKLKETLQDLKQAPHNAQLQQKFTAAIDEIYDCLYEIYE